MAKQTIPIDAVYIKDKSYYRCYAKLHTFTVEIFTSDMEYSGSIMIDEFRQDYIILKDHRDRYIDEILNMD